MDDIETLTRLKAQDIEALARLKAQETYPGAWGEEYDPDDEQSRVCMAQLVEEFREQITKGAGK